MIRRFVPRRLRRYVPLGSTGHRPSTDDVRRHVTCWVWGHWFDGQFCGRCGWFLP
jgi:hypothetical protein